MAFWSSQTIEARLKGQKLVDPYRDTAVDCNSYTLTIGPEIYVTPAHEQGKASTHTKRKIEPGEAFPIPAGQFAFLISEETVTIPTNVMAFISIKAHIKFRGLVNVSGFHIDPGWSGRLIFSVFNAGPSTVHLQRGQDMFLMWLADLDQPSEKHKSGVGPEFIPTNLINNITGELNSLQNLDTRLRDLEKQLNERIHAVENLQTRIHTLLWIVVTLGVGAAGYMLRGWLLTQ